ncbi:MAG: DUF4860 domain-containing protein [Peptoanaerobacter stomatis]|jgi:hypothetical protein|uniref:DUF4860 domain-containing protein n=1 Tax=Peptoanaerobacter stomatis TaxID=796937 RepID=G9XBR7_9FIRM|nr:DUF4860 domain-containing protein [Peptoanaerobacter stomatis]EHL16378.1 hypothetical protein HMPREF9629_01218 [Peptoanaerobacter stomatis]EHL19622.1 hypothetical protein HMPREF9628_01434 [Peptoanaerobacter stomatis]
MNKKSNGKTRLETMLVMLLLIVFGISTYTLVVVTATSYEKTQAETTAKDNLRLASSYIESKLRSANKDNVKIVDSIFDSQSKAIILEEKLEGDTYQTAIYYKDNALREIYIKKGTQLEDTSGFEIAKIDKFDIEKLQNNTLNISFATSANEQDYDMQTIVNLN